MRNYRQIAQEMSAVGTEFVQARSAAYKSDPDLTPEAQGRAVAQRLEAVQTEYAAKFDALLTRAQRERDAAMARAAKARPTLDGSDVAAMVRTEQAWSHNVRPALESGRDLAEALAHAGADEALGAERFAVSWLEMHANPDAAVDAHRHVVGRVVAEAFARLAKSDADAAAVLDGEAADREFEVLREAIGHTRAGRALEAAMALQYTDLPQSRLAEEAGEPVAG